MEDRVVPKLRHLATADIGPLHCVLYRDAEGHRELHLYARGEGPWSERWIGALPVTGAPMAAPNVTLTAFGRALAWAREVRP